MAGGEIAIRVSRVSNDLPEDVIRPAPLLKKTGALMLSLGVRSFSIKAVKLPFRTSVHACACKSMFPLFCILHATHRVRTRTELGHLTKWDVRC